MKINQQCASGIVRDLQVSRKQNNTMTKMTAITIIITIINNEDNTIHIVDVLICTDALSHILPDDALRKISGKFSEYYEQYYYEKMFKKVQCAILVILSLFHLLLHIFFSHTFFVVSLVS